jgi:hypothetical protein
MSSSPEEQAPKRLQEHPDETGVLLRRAAQEFSTGLTEPAAWEALRERQARYRAAQWIGAVGLALAVIVVAALIRKSPSETVALTPEIQPHLLQRTGHPPAPETQPPSPAAQTSRKEATVPRATETRESITVPPPKVPWRVSTSPATQRRQTSAVTP